MKKNIYIIIGSIVIAFGFYFFLLQHDIAAGGISGLSIVLSNIFNTNVGVLNLMLNMVVLFLGGVFISWRFSRRSLLSAIVVSGTIIILENVFPDTILTNDIILNVIMGPLTVAVGLGLVFYNGGSSGGTDVIATIINKYTDVSIPTCLLATDMLVILLAIVVIGLEPSLYAALAVIIQTVALDNVIQGLGKKIAVYIISDKYDEINEVLTKKYSRGVTLLNAEGGYTHKDRKVLMTICNVRRYPVIRNQILALDDRAFIFTNTISEVVGEGFTVKQL